MARRLAFLALAAFAFATASVAWGASLGEDGRPAVRAFPAPVTDRGTQAFDLVALPNGIVLVAGAGGVMEFDGARWRQIRLPGQAFARVLEVDATGRTYVGGSAATMGYIERAAGGVGRYVNLGADFIPQAERLKIGDIWGVALDGDRVVWHAPRDLFLWSPSGIFERISVPEAIGGFATGGRALFLLVRGRGLVRLEGSRFVDVPGGTDLIGTYSITTAPLDGERTLIIGNDERVWRLDLSGVHPVAREGTDLPDQMPYHMLGLPGGRIALGGDGGLIEILGPDLKRERAVQVDNTEISGLQAGPDGGLLAVSTLGLYHLALPSPWTFYDSRDGLAGTVTQVLATGDSIVVSSFAGLFEASAGDQGPTRFHRVPGPKEPGWHAHRDPLGGLIVAYNYTLHRRDASGRFTPAGGRIFPRTIVPSRFVKDRLYVFTERGLAVFDQAADGSLRERANHTSFEQRLFPAVEIANGDFWCSTSDDGLHRVRLSEDGTAVASDTRYVAAEGLPMGDLGAMVSEVDGRVLIGTDRGMYEFDDSRFVPTALPDLAALPQTQGLPSLERSGDGTLWLTDAGRTWYRRPDQDWRLLDLFNQAGVLSGPGGMDARGGVWLGMLGSVARYRAGPEPDERPLQPVLIREAQYLDGGRKPSDLPLADEPPLLAPDFTALTLEYAMPVYSGAQAVEYQTRLLGLDAGWSGWTAAARQQFGRLAPGTYRFEVQARSGGSTAPAAAFDFVVARPWYDATAWRALWLALAAAALTLAGLGLVRWRVAAFRRQNLALEATVAERTRDLAARSAELEQANRQLRTLAERDGLTGVANRRRLDELLTEAVAACERDHRPLCLMLIDVDHFKHFNDRHGHLQGDQALREVARLLADFAGRHGGIVGRYGGEEFVVALRGVGLDTAHALADSLRDDAARTGLREFDLTISIGVADNGGGTQDLQRMLARADQALYEAKDAGRNRVIVARADA